MKLVEMHGTETQVKQAEKRRENYIKRWQKHLESAKSRNASEDHIKLIESVVEYASNKGSAIYWNTIPTSGTIIPRVEMLELDEHLFDLSIACNLAWMKLNGIEPRYLTLLSNSGTPNSTETSKGTRT